MLSGRLTVFSFSHSENVDSFISVTFLGMVIFVRDVHPQKAHSPMLVTADGMVISVRDVHPQKAYSPMLVTVDGMVIFFNFLKFR